MVKKAYLYLARRDKKGAKLVARLESPEQLTSRVPDVRTLNLHPEMENDIQKIVHEHRMEWELWIETVDSYNQLKKNLAKRGYTDVSNHGTPMVIEVTRIVNPIRMAKFPKVMIQRKT